MKKQTREPVPMRAFKFSCRVVSGHDMIAQVINEGVEYYNAKVYERKLELQSQQDCLCEVVPGWAELTAKEADLTEAIAELKERFAKMKSKFGRTKEKPPEFVSLRDELAALQAEKKVVWDQRKALKPIYEESFKNPNLEFKERVNAISRDSSGRAHPVMISKNKPVVLEELAATAHPAWVEHHRRILAQGAVSRAIRRAGHSDSMDLVLADVQRAIKDAGLTAPRPRRRGVGQIGCAVSPPLPWSSVVDGKAPRFRMQKQVDTGKRLRGLDSLVQAQLTVNGVGIELSVLQHRKIPEDAKLCRVVLQASQFKGRIEYYVILTMEHPSFKAESKGRGTVAVNFGWRKTGNGFRAMYLVDDEGNASSVCIPHDIPQRIEHAENLLSIRDRIFVAFRKEALRLESEYEVFPSELWIAVRDHLRSLGKAGDVEASLAAITGNKFNWFLSRVVGHYFSRETIDALYEDWLQRHYAEMAKWEEHERRGPKPDLWEPHFETFKAINYGREMSDKQLLVFWFETWRRKHMHLSRWSADVRSQATRRRLDFYRNMAATLAKEYGTLVIDDTDFSKLARRLTMKQKESLPADEVAIREQGNSHRFIVSPSELRQCLIAKFGKAKTVVVKAAGLSSQHYKDEGDIDSVFGASSGICSVCGTHVELDHNACVNALIRAGVIYNPPSNGKIALAHAENDAIQLAGE